MTTTVVPVNRSNAEATRPELPVVRCNIVDIRPMVVPIPSHRMKIKIKLTAKLPKNTLKWKSWIGQPPEEMEPEPSDAAPYKLTQAEFRRLNDQVKETSASPSVRQRGSGFKGEELRLPNASDMFMTYEGKTVPRIPSRQGVYVVKTAGSRALSQCGTYAIPNPFPPQKFLTNDHGETNPVIHRSQLATSFKTFQEKRWRPYEGTTRDVHEGSTRPSSRLSSRPSSSSSIRSEQRLLDKRASSAGGQKSGSPVHGRPPRPRSVAGGDHVSPAYHHPANIYESHQREHTREQRDQLNQRPCPNVTGQLSRATQEQSSQPPSQSHGSQQSLAEGQAYYVDSFGDQVLVGSHAGTQTTSDGHVPPKLESGPAVHSLGSRRSSMTPAATEITTVVPGATAEPYDTLTPEIIFQLSTGPRPLSVYGSRPTCFTQRELGRSNRDCAAESKEGVLADEVFLKEGDQREETSPSSAKRDTDSTSGIGTDKESDDEVDDEGDRDSNDSDDDRIPEPTLEDVKMADLPRLNLRPEQLDSIYVPDERHDRRRYDFDPSRCERIPFEFKDALSPSLMALDMYHVSLSDRNWRSFCKGPASDETEERIVERLLELERLQRKTKEAETVRRDRLRSANVRARSRVGVVVRQQSAKLGERRCCSDCLQVACVGDCPGKRGSMQPPGSSMCLVCAEKDCQGKCCESAYDARSRQTRPPEEEPKKPMRFRPRSCNSCTGKNPSKVANANNILLGRPKSSYSTFSSAQNAGRPTKDFRVKSGNIPQELETEFQRLGIDPESEQPAASGEKPTTSSTGRRKLKGRASQLPGKSFFSQRRHSLTDIAKEMRVKSANKKRLKSVKKKSNKESDV